MATASETRPTEKPARARAASLRRLVSLAKPEWKRLLWGTVFLFLGSGMGLVFPQAIREIVDGALTAKDEALVNRAALGLLVIFGVQALAVAGRFYLFATTGERVVSRLRADLFASLIRQEIAFFDQRRTGELTSRLSSDTSVLQSAVSANISMALRNLATVVGGIALLFYTSPILTALMLGVVPPVALGAVIYGRRVRKLARDVQDAVGKTGEIAEESLAGIRTVRAFTAEAAETKRYREAVMTAFEIARKRIVASSTFMSLASFFASGAAVLVLWYGGRLVFADRMTVGELTSFLVYTLMVAFSLGALTELYADFNRAGGAAERVFELIDRVPAIPPTGGLTLPKVEGRLTFEKVGFAYPTRKELPVLRGIDLSLAPGERVAVVGPSGAGKSTLAALIGRLYDPDEGRILLDGADLRTLDPEWLRRQIGVVSQEPILFSSSIEENIRYGRPDASDAEIEAAARAANAHDFITGFPDGYRTLVGERGVQLSGGQKQRVAIARALLKDPRLLILDEATSALDSESEHLVQEALERLMHGRTTLVIAHRLSTVIGADRVLVLEGGRIIQSGTHARLVEQEGLYRRLVERQFVAA
ncbi:MAG: ATP-binding cassette domain-containing protein [Myxococcaceae bacterium]|nr:ATP-binding cassette domain-containing protein [Myxococcaceae bacterium]